MIPAPLWRPIRVTAILVVAGIAWVLWSDTQGARKMASLATDSAQRYDVIITLNFPPDAFHLTRAQEIGQLIKADGPRLYLRGVTHAQLNEYARAYWVQSVAPWTEGK